MEDRLKMKTEFGKWLHAYICTHRKGSDLGVKTLMSYYGSQQKRQRDFVSKQLRPTLIRMQVVGIIKNYSIYAYNQRVSWKT